MKKLLAGLILSVILISPVYAQSGNSGSGGTDRDTGSTRDSASSATRSSDSSEVTRTDIRERLKDLKDGVDRNLTPEERQALIDELRGKDADTRCAQLSQNVQARLEYYSDNKSMYVEYANRIHDNVQNAVSRLDALGFDTDALKAELLEIQQLVSDLRNAYANMAQTAEQVSANVCNYNQGDKPEEVTKLQTQLKQMRVFAAQIKTKFQEDIVPLLRDLKAQASQSTSSSSAESES